MAPRLLPSQSASKGVEEEVVVVVVVVMVECWDSVHDKPRMGSGQRPPRQTAPGTQPLALFF